LQTSKESVLHIGRQAGRESEGRMNAAETHQNALQGDKKEKAGKDTGWSENGLKRL